MRDDEAIQAQWNTDLRARFVAEIALLPPTPTLLRWRNAGRAFAVATPAGTRFPAFQFDAGRPRPLIGQLLELLRPWAGDWGTALWFITPNRYLAGEGRPIDHIDDDAALLQAVRGTVQRPLT